MQTKVSIQKLTKMCGFLNSYHMTTKRPVDPYRKSVVDCGPGHATIAAVYTGEND